jgi:hypothetical protein
MTHPAHKFNDDYDILGGDSEDVLDALPIPPGNYDIFDESEVANVSTVVEALPGAFAEQTEILGGAVDEVYTGPNMLEQLDDESDDDILGGEADGYDVLGDDDDDPEPDDGKQYSEDYGIEIPSAGGDPSVLENRRLLNFGGDLPDAAAPQWDFGDEIPAASTEVYGDGEDSIEGDGLEGDDTDDILGDAAIDTHDPAFQEYLAREVAAAAPLILEKDQFAGAQAREFDFGFGPVWAPAGRETTIKVSPQCLFRGEKILATDTHSTPGTGTRIIQVAVGQKIQKPGGRNGTLTRFFSETALTNGIKFDTAHPWSEIAVTVSFVQECTFDMSVFGRAIIE